MRCSTRSKTWGRWGDQASRGALNNLTPERVAAAAQLARRGLTVTLSLAEHGGAPRLPRARGPPHDDAQRSGHRLRERTLAKDFVGVDYHNDGHSHIDAFCHVAYEGRLYGGVPDTDVTADGAQSGSIDILKDGLIGRGVLLDVPRLRGVPWLEPGEDVYLEGPGSGRAGGGHQRRPPETSSSFALAIPDGLLSFPPWENGRGPRPACIQRDGVVPPRRERSVAALGSDGNNDTAPSTTEGVAFPIHVLALNAMGVHLLDYLQLDEVARLCEQERRGGSSCSRLRPCGLCAGPARRSDPVAGLLTVRVLATRRYPGPAFDEFDDVEVGWRWLRWTRAAARRRGPRAVFE